MTDEPKRVEIRDGREYVVTEVAPVNPPPRRKGMMTKKMARGIAVGKQLGAGPPALLGAAEERQMWVDALPRRVAHATFALLFCEDPRYGPYTASEVVLYDPEAPSVRSTAAALREANKRGLAINVRGLWMPTTFAYEAKRQLEERFLRDTESEGPS